MDIFAVAYNHRFVRIGAFTVYTKSTVCTDISALSAVSVVRCQVDDDAIAFRGILHTFIFLDMISFHAFGDIAFFIPTDPFFPLANLIFADR